MWKANTSALVVDALKFDREKREGMSRRVQDKAKDICSQLAPLIKLKYEGFVAQVFDIIREALDLDQLFSKQVADIYWIRGSDEPRRFNEEYMELQQGEKRAVDGQKVQLVVAPGLIKRGRSTGEHYEMESILLRITVSCELITADSSGESHKPPLTPRDSSKPGAKIRGFFTTTKEPKTERP